MYDSEALIFSAPILEVMGMTIEEMKAALEAEGYLVTYKHGSDPFTKRVKQYIHEKLVEVGKNTVYYHNMVNSNTLIHIRALGYHSYRGVPEAEQEEVFTFLTKKIQDFMSWKGWGS